MSRRERVTEEIRSTYETVVARDGYACFVCGVERGTELAHVLPQDVLHKSRYGIKVIHHPLNLRWTCRACNAKVQINYRSRPREAEQHAASIRLEIEQEENHGKS